VKFARRRAAIAILSELGLVYIDIIDPQYSQCTQKILSDWNQILIDPDIETKRVWFSPSVVESMILDSLI
tara:strand:- start:778 stop:987 length:210 start_codon:yes stop_codon:yes gene_type:complete